MQKKIKNTVAFDLVVVSKNRGKSTYDTENPIRNTKNFVLW